MKERNEDVKGEPSCLVTQTIIIIEKENIKWTTSAAK